MAQIHVRWGNRNLEQFNQAMGTLTRLFGAEGIVLRHGLLTEFGGQLYEVWNLWEVEDAAHMSRARQGLRARPEYHDAHALLAEVVQYEQIRYCSSLPYLP